MKRSLLLGCIALGAVASLGLAYSRLTAAAPALALSSAPVSAIASAVAESQAMMWAGLLDVHRRVDNDQVHLFVHVREEARRWQIYINRYLKREDRVSADRWTILSMIVPPMVSRSSSCLLAMVSLSSLGSTRGGVSPARLHARS